jgi:hypothetical protein
MVPALKRFWARMYRPDYVLCKNDALFQWQFLGPAGAAGGAFNLKLALVDGEIAGTLGSIPVEVSLDRRVVRGAWLANWVVDPERRRLGLGPLLMREVTGRVEVTLNGGPNLEARSVLTRMGWTDLGQLTRHVLVLDAEKAASLTRSGRIDWPPVGRPDVEGARGINVAITARFTPDATDLWDSLAPSLGAGTRRTAQYLNWRYIDHPVWQYCCVEARHGGQLRGVAVYRVEPVRDRPVQLGRIVEVIGEEAAASALVATIVNEAASRGLAALDFFCSSPQLASTMRAHGFLAGDESPAAQLPMLFQPLDHRRSAIHFMAHLPRDHAPAISHWYVTKSDADQDRPN